MKKVDIVFTGSLKQIIGPMGTMKRIIKNDSYFRSRGYEVTVFTNDSIPNNTFGVPTLGTYKKSRIKGYIKSLYRILLQKSYLLDRIDMARTEKPACQLADYYLGLNRDVDIVEFHSGKECEKYLLERKNPKPKVVLFQHSDGLPFEMIFSYYPKLRGTKYIKKREDNCKKMFDSCSQLAFIAAKGRENFINAFPFISKDKITLILNGIDDLNNEQKSYVEAARKEDDTAYAYKLCCVGTVNGRKGQRIIIEALNRTKALLKEQIHVSIVGEGQERSQLEELVRKYQLVENVSFEGAVPNENVYKNLAQANIFILMSNNEGLPISIIEAMRAGLPIISTNIAGIPELVREQYNGVLLDPDVDQLTDVFNRMNSYNWDEMGKRSRERFENEFTFDRMKKEFCDMYDLVINRD